MFCSIESKSKSKEKERKLFYLPFVVCLRYRPANENQIYKALQVLDVDKKGYYTKEDLVRMMTSEGKESLEEKKFQKILRTKSIKSLEINYSV